MIADTGSLKLPEAPEALPLGLDADGVARVGKTRVTLETVVGAFLDGASAEEVVIQYPSLDLGDVYAVIGFFLRHRTEVEAYLHQCRKHAEEARLENEKKTDPTGVRDRLLARRVKQGC